MARIEVDSIVGMEGEVADSILGDDNIIASYSDAGLAQRVETPQPQEQQEEQETSEFAVHGDDLLNEAIGERKADVLRYGDAVRQEEEQPGEQGPKVEDLARQAAKPGERFLTPEQAEELRQQQEQEQTERREPTEQEIQAGIEKLDSDVKELGLNDPQGAREFADAFCNAFGTSVYNSGTNVEALGQVMAKATLSAVQIYDAMARGQGAMREVPPAAAREFTRDLLTAWGIDPRQMTTPVNEVQLANTVFYGFLNLFDTYQRSGGRVTDVSKLNDPQAAEQFLQNFIGSFGVTGKVSRQSAIQFADACAKQALGILGKLKAAADRAGERTQGPARKSGQRIPKQFSEGIKGQTAPRFRTNADVFDGGAQAWQQLHGRL